MCRRADRTLAVLTVDGFLLVWPVLEALLGTLVEGAVLAESTLCGRHGGSVAPGGGGHAGGYVQGEVGGLKHRFWGVEVVLFRLDGS